MLAKIIPQQIKVDTSDVIRGSFGDMEALRKEIKRRGLDLNRLLNEATKQQPSQSNK